MYLWILLVVLVALALILRAFATKSGLIPSKKRNLTSKAVLMQEHHWEETTETGFYYCSSCDEVDGNLFNKQILTCIICGALKHSSCPSNSNIKCKSMTYGSATLFNSHQWLRGSLPLNCTCDSCGLMCGSVYGLEASRCMWCHRVVHKTCMQKLPETCDFGKLAKAIIFPSQVKVFQKHSKNVLSKIKEEAQLKMHKIQPLNIKFNVGENKQPIVAIVNKRSGGQVGAKILSSFYDHLNPIQVIDLIDEGLERLKDFRSLENLKIIVGGGDGTISATIDFIKNNMQDIDQDKVKFCAPIAVLPLGTGNDLSQSLGWGPGMTVPDVKSHLINVLKDSEPVVLDRWTTTIERLSSKGKVKSTIRNTMLNYLGIGLDAKITLDFHKTRERYPYLFKSRLGNKIIYGHMGTCDFLFGKPHNISQLVTLICDGEKISFSGLQGIVIQNIDFWGGGVRNIWGDLTTKDSSNSVDSSSYSDTQNLSPERETHHQQKSFKKQSFCDGNVEVIGFKSVLHMGQSQAGLAYGIRLCQGSKIELAVEKKGTTFPIQIDGEPFELKSPFRIRLGECEKVNMFMRKKWRKFNTESKVIQVLSNAELLNKITAEQKAFLLDEFIKELST